ncbi:hypothetical protein PMAYCL1PPCAC_04744, partial [Pristionchus mayeri]
SNVKRVKVGRPAAVDEYHCKIMCVEMNECLSYIFTDYECFLLGKKYTDSSTCILPYYEWVKKYEDSKCPADAIAQPKIDDGYVPNPALSRISSRRKANIEFNKEPPCQTERLLSDAFLPDNSHRVEGNYGSYIVWDGKL